VNLRSWVWSAWASLLESISSLGFIIIDESDTCNFWVLLSDKEISTHPFGLSVFIDVYCNFTVVLIKIIFCFLLIFLLALFRCLLGWRISGIKEDSQVIIGIFPYKLDLGTVVVDIPSVIVKKVNILAVRWFVLVLVLDFFIKFFLENVSSVGGEISWSDLGSFGDWWGEDFNHLNYIYIKNNDWIDFNIYFLVDSGLNILSL